MKLARVVFLVVVVDKLAVSASLYLDTVVTRDGTSLLAAKGAVLLEWPH